MISGQYIWDGSTDGWTWCRLNLMRWWQQMVTNDVVEKSNKLVHGLYKEHYQFVKLDGSKFDYNFTQRFQNKPICWANFGWLTSKWPIWGVCGVKNCVDFKFCLISVNDHGLYWSFYARLILLICAFLTFIFFKIGFFFK